MASPVRTRFAPSPTGFLHVGGARTALFNWLFARRQGGAFLLRIEDTDLERSTESSAEQIVHALQWLGLDWDEGPFFQSDRLALYQEHLLRLRDAGRIYPAFETKEELEAMRLIALQEKRNAIYDGRARRLPKEDVERRLERGDPFVWRFQVPETGETVVPESLMGGQGGARFENAAIGDFAITRPGSAAAPGMPLYNFVCTVDDALMGISHVIRGVEHLSNSPKQVLLYQALGYPLPSFTHLPLVMRQGKKMSKRDDLQDQLHPVSVSGRRALGYLPEATNNFLSLLGWSHPEEQEFLDRAELLRTFDLDRLSRANANFDEDKYLHLNGRHIRAKPAAALVAEVLPFLRDHGLTVAGRDPAWLAAIVSLETERCNLLGEFPQRLAYFFADPEAYEEAGARKHFTPAGLASLAAAADALAPLDDWSAGAIEAAVRALAGRLQVKLGEIAQPLRLALTGRTATPGLFEVMSLLDRDTVLRRLAAARQRAGAGATPAAGAAS